MTNFSEDYLITKLFEGTCSREELVQLLHLIESNPSKDYTAVMEKLWDAMQEYAILEPKVSDRIYEKTLSKIKADKEKKINGILRLKWLKLAEVAAVFLLLICLSLWLYDQSVKLITIETTFAEQRTIVLPDSSTINLNANSSISYYDNWTHEEDRKVWLKGEAFFKVLKKEKTGQKFCVITEDLTVEVLGTSFNINTHHNQTQVFLEEGKVKLNLDQEPQGILMSPGELISYSNKTKKTIKLISDQKEPASWRDGFVLLKDVSLKEILQKINEIYGLEYSLTNTAHLTRSFTIGIPTNNFDTMFTVLQEVTRLSIQKHDNKLVIE